MFLIWLWITNLAILLGAELDAEVVRSHALRAGLSPSREPYLELRDDRKAPKNATAANADASSG